MASLLTDFQAVIQDWGEERYSRKTLTAGELAQQLAMPLVYRVTHPIIQRALAERFGIAPPMELPLGMLSLHKWEGIILVERCKENGVLVFTLIQRSDA